MSEKMLSMDGESLERAVALLGGTEASVRKALSRSINRATIAARQEAVKQTRANYTAKAGGLRSSMEIRKASAKNVTGYIVSTGKTLPLTEFYHSPKKPSGSRRKPIGVAVRKGPRRAIKGSFVGKSGNGTAIFVRFGKKRLPIRALHGPSIPQMIGNPEVMSKVSERARQVLEQRFEHELEREIDSKTRGR